MSIELQMKLKSNPNYINYLHENSNWYKYLNRSDKYFKKFEEEMKKNYHLTFSDKISSAINTIELMQSILNINN